MTIIRTKARRPQDHIYSVLVPHTTAYSYTYKYHKYSNNLALNKFKEPAFTRQGIPQNYSTIKETKF